MWRFRAEIVILCLAALVEGVQGCREAVPENIALHRPYRVSPAPNYPSTGKDQHGLALTDGKYSRGVLWKDPGTLGWNRTSPISIEVDLGSEQTISGAGFHTAAGRAEVQFPLGIIALVSPDGRDWYRIGDLVADSDEIHGPPPTSGYANSHYWTDRWRAHGRLFKFVVIPRGEYCFVDEVEVYKGDPSALSDQTASKPIASLDSLLVEEGVRRRVRADRHAVEKTISLSALPAEVKHQLTGDLRRLDSEAVPSGPDHDPLAFRAILPFGPTHERILAVQAHLWRHVHPQTFEAWVPSSPYDPLPYVTTMPVPNLVLRETAVTLMQGETRSVAINLVNASEHPIAARLRVEGLPGGTNPDWVHLLEAVWTDTRDGSPVLTALRKLDRRADGWKMSVVPGLPAQAWFTLRPDQAVAPGEYDGTVAIETDHGDSARVPVHVSIVPVQLSGTRLHLGGFDYTDREDQYGVTPDNRLALAALLREYLVDIAWATNAVLPPGQYDPAGRMVKPPDTEPFDQWVSQWPGAAKYYVFANAGDHVGGHAVGTAPFEHAVSDWARFWSAHARSKGFHPGQLGLLLVDEPSNAEDEARFVQWGSIVKRNAPDILLWEDPTRPDPTSMNPRVAVLSDVLCPPRTLWMRGGAAFARFFEAQRSAGKGLALYSSHGPAELLDPYRYYRLQAWHSFAVGATEEHFWSFVDTGGPSSWNPYLARSPSRSPLFLDPTGVTASKQMEAIREGIEDYETLAMLRGIVLDRQSAGSDDSLLRQSIELLSRDVADVIGQVPPEDLSWDPKTDRLGAETVRLRAVRILAAFAESGVTTTQR